MQATTVRPTAAVRAILRDNGFDESSMYTNKYDTCRTVKLYGSIDATIEADILDTMKVLGVQGVTVKRHTYSGIFGTAVRGRPVTIVRIPR